MASHTLNVGAATFISVMGKVQPSLYTPLPEAHSFYAQIGRVAAEWTQFQHILQMIIWHLEGVRNLGKKQVHTNRAPAAYLFRKIAEHLISNGRGNLLQQIALTENVIEHLTEERNRIIHDPWYIELNTNQAAQFRYIVFNGQNFGFHDVPEIKISDMIEQIKALQKSAHELRAAL